MVMNTQIFHGHIDAKKDVDSFVSIIFIIAIEYIFQPCIDVKLDTQQSQLEIRWINVLLNNIQIPRVFGKMKIIVMSMC